jgi:hypothetical protein
MSDEIEKTRELKFKCPGCESNKLRASAAGWLEIDHVYDDGVFHGATSRSNSLRRFNAVSAATT